MVWSRAWGGGKRVSRRPWSLSRYSSTGILEEEYLQRARLCSHSASGLRRYVACEQRERLLTARAASTSVPFDKNVNVEENVRIFFVVASSDTVVRIPSLDDQLCFSAQVGRAAHGGRVNPLPLRDSYCRPHVPCSYGSRAQTSRPCRILEASS